MTTYQDLLTAFEARLDRARERASQTTNPARYLEWEEKLRPDAAEVVAVTAKPVSKGTAWRYFATLKDGSTVVLRKKSTALATHAFRYSFKVASGASGLAAEFSYSTVGQPKGKAYGPCQSFPVTVE
jgi:hypothetical protein